MQTLLIEKRAELIIILLLFFLVIISPLHIFGQQTEPNNAVVRYHLSFDDDKFFKEDIIEQSGKKSLEERKIDFPPGKFGKGIRMREIPPVTDAINMTGIDLDLVTAVIFNTRPGNEMGFNQPFIWGSGRINPRLGSVAFWAKGALSFAAPLFEQTSVGFGRKERELLGIVVDENNILSAYIRDARYVKHTLKSSYSWEPNQWNHVVLNWDWAKGMELWVNGMIVASSWGRDAWFENTLPGLFHLPAPGLTYDELYLLDRPLSAKEIKQLLRKNQAPDPVGYKRDQVVNQKILEISGVNAMDDLPTAEPGHTLVFREVFPENVSDGHIPGWYVVDGRNEIAWPHPTAMFTIIPGDADFHAEKVDLATSSSSRVNYAIVTGNLDKVRLQASTERLPGMENMFSVPTGEEFIFASTFATQRGATFRIPFTESFGTPDDFSGNIHVPLSGDKRIQNIQLYYCQSKSASVYPIGDKLIIQPGFMTMDERWSVAFQALTSGDERKIVIATDHPESRSVGEYDISTFARLNIISEPYTDPTGIKTITLSLPVHCEKTEEVLFIRLRDPAVPSRIWNQLAIKLVNYNQGYKTFQLKIDCEDLVLTGGDRLWLDLGTAGKSNILTGDSQNEAALYVEEAPVYEVLNAYSTKELISAKAQYSKMYEFMPWQFTGKDVSLELPYCFGGPFDMLLPALAVHRVDPNNFEANYLIKVSGPDYKDGKPIHPEKTALISLPNPLQAPDWALYMHDFNLKRHKMADWWADQQNEDGQIGGGWNDDVLFLSFHQPDLPLDGNENARYLIDATHKGLEATRYFKDGYCNVYPMDRLHIGDFISERYNTLVNNLGQAYVYEREMESAWHLGKEEQTPVNYFADGFKSSVNVFNWYWGNDIPETPYESKSLDELTDEFRLYTSVFDEYAYYRFTESNVHRDDYSPYGANNMYTYMMGGKRGTRLDAHMKLAVTWPCGGGPEVARVVTYADDTSLQVVAYSFDECMRNLQTRLCRIKSGIYRMAMYQDADGAGKKGKLIWEQKKRIDRFDIVEWPIPPQSSVVLEVEQLEPISRPEELPDLSIDLWDVSLDGNALECLVHNLGDGAAENIIVRLMDGDSIIEDVSIDKIEAPLDFIAKRKKVIFRNVNHSGNLRVVLDPENEIDEIMEENNEIPVFINASFTPGLAPKKNGVNN